VPGFVYVDYNDAKGLERAVRRINALGRLRGLVPGKGRKGACVVLEGRLGFGSGSGGV